VPRTLALGPGARRGAAKPRAGPHRRVLLPEGGVLPRPGHRPRPDRL